MNCEEFVLHSEEWMEGNRSAQAREHAAACERCRSLVEDLDAIRLAALQMVLDAEPPASLWQSIRAQLESEGLIRHAMDCEEFALQTEEWMEGNRSAQVREHAMACERCRSFVEDLDAIRLAAPQMALDAEPPATLWQSIRAQLKEEGLIRHMWRPARAIRWIPVSSRPFAVAAAALVLALLTFTVTWRPARPPAPAPAHTWLSADETELTNVDRQLDHVESNVGAFHTTDPAVQDTLRQNLMIVNRQIARCEKTLEQAPSDENTRDYLYDAYQQKAELLNLMAERSSDATE